MEMAPAAPRQRSPAQLVLDEQALQLRSLGLTYRELANRLEVHVSTAHERVMRALAEHRRKLHESPSDTRQIELSKLAQIERRVLAQALSGDHAAIRLLLKIIHCRKTYLSANLVDTTTSDELQATLRNLMLPDIGMAPLETPEGPLETPEGWTGDAVPDELSAVGSLESA